MSDLFDLIDIPRMIEAMNAFFAATGLPSTLLDPKNNVVASAGWVDICTRFYRLCPATERRCRESDLYILQHLNEGPYVGYRCLNGLMNYAAPIVIDGKHIATIFTGQFVHESPDEDAFRRLGQECGFDMPAYMAALRKVPVIPEKDIPAIMATFTQLAQSSASLPVKRRRAR
jgi:ligand-binding sensor protein